MKLSEPVMQPVNVWEAPLEVIVDWSDVVLLGADWSGLLLLGAVVWSGVVVLLGAVVWSGVVLLLGAVLWSGVVLGEPVLPVCANVIAAPSMNVAKSVFFILVFPLLLLQMHLSRLPVPVGAGESVA